MANMDIPPGFVLLAKYDTRVGEEHKSGPRGDYAKLLRELAKDSPCIAAYKDRGQWVARESDILRFLEQLPKRPAASKRRRSDLEVSRRAVAVLERIADALEAMATQPKNDNQTPFGTYLHASTNGDE